MADLHQFALVRIRCLLKSIETYDGWGVNQRPPQVGDVGTLLDILNAPNLTARYVVESSGSDGASVWLSDFAADELESF